MKKYVLAFIFLALALSACRIESNILLDINEDGSARIGAEIGFDEEMLALVGQSGGDPTDIVGELSDIAGQGVESINRVEGDMTYFGATIVVDDLSTYGFDGIQSDTFSEFSYTFDDAGATLAARVDATGIGDFTDGELPIDPSQITAEVFSGNVVVNMPGEVVEHNADTVRADGTLVWSLPLTGSTEIFARTTFGTSGAGSIWIIPVVVLLIGGGAATAAVMMSRKKDTERMAIAEADLASEIETTEAETEIGESESSDDSDVEPEGGDSSET